MKLGSISETKGYIEKHGKPNKKEKIIGEEMKKVLFAVMAIVLALGLMGSAFAYFSSTQASSGNTFSAGNISLAMSNDNSTWVTNNSTVIGSAANMAPGHDVGPFNVFFKDAGTVSGVVTAVVSYPRNAATDAYAQVLDVTKVNAYEGGVWVGVQAAGYWAEQIVNTQSWSWAQGVAAGYIAADPNTGDGNTFGYVPTVYGLQTVTLHFTAGYAYQAPWGDLTLAPGASEGDQMYLQLDPSAGNAFQNNSMPLTVTGTITSN
jgi:predicted ribosomally synthesized peptide with SipW-like signal peptide